jgi:prepilin-type N-terminal cleavage/methylation domain-containing protein
MMRPRRSSRAFTLIELLVVMGLLAATSCARRPAAPQLARPPSPQPVDDFLLLSPPPGAVEVAPGLHASAQIGAWNERKGDKRPGRPFSDLHASDKPAFGVTVSFFPGRSYRGGEVRYRELLALPAPPQRWDEPDHSDLPEASRPRQTITADRRACVTEHTIFLKPGQMIPSVQTPDAAWILHPFPIHEWGIYGHDPAGEWTLEAFVNDRRVARARFHVHVPPSPADPDPDAEAPRSKGTTRPNTPPEVQPQSRPGNG